MGAEMGPYMSNFGKVFNENAKFKGRIVGRRSVCRHIELCMAKIEQQQWTKKVTSKNTFLGGHPTGDCERQMRS